MKLIHHNRVWISLRQDREKPIGSIMLHKPCIFFLTRCDLISDHGYALLNLRVILVIEHASPFSHSVPGWEVALYLRIKDKSVVKGRDWEHN